MRRSFLAFLLIVIAGNTLASAQQMNEKDSPCADVVATVELASCLSGARAIADEKLNALYKTLRAKLDDANDRRLVAAQRLWIQYRDANCTAARDLYAGGTAASPAHLACLEAMTRARTMELSVTYAVKLK